jgi:hypothetical protein
MSIHAYVLASSTYTGYSYSCIYSILYTLIFILYIYCSIYAGARRAYIRAPRSRLAPSMLCVCNWCVYLGMRTAAVRTWPYVPGQHGRCMHVVSEEPIGSLRRRRPESPTRHESRGPTREGSSGTRVPAAQDHGYATQGRWD